MTTKVEKSITVRVPVTTVYNQWTQFEQFPQFMGGVQEVTQVDDTTLHWVAEIAGVRREWDAAILEQVPDQKVAWAALDGATNAGAVRFAPSGPDHTMVTLHLEYEPEGIVEKAGDALSIVERQAESDLERFKTFIEGRGTETGAWRGGVNEDLDVGTPGVEEAALSGGDSGKAGVSGKAVAAGVAAVAVGAAGVAAASAMGERGRCPGARRPGRRRRAHRRPPRGDGPHRRHLGDRRARGRSATWRTCSSVELVRHAVGRGDARLSRHARAPPQRRGRGGARHRGAPGARGPDEGAGGPSTRPTHASPQCCGRLESTFVDHVADEEREHFPQLRASLPREDLVELASKVETAKRLAPTRPHPSSPNSELFHKVVGPGVGLVDRLRDRLSGRATS